MKNKLIKIIVLSTLLIGVCSIRYASGIIVSKKDLYPSYIKTPQDINDWLVNEGFYYKSDKNKSDEWKTPKQTIKDKGNDCEDYAILTCHILKELGYKSTALMAIFGEDLGHGICWFKETDDSWSFFSVSSNTLDEYKFYHSAKFTNPFHILYYYFPKWNSVYLITEKGQIVKSYLRSEIERSKK